MTTTKEPEVTKHQPVIKSNGCTVCSCGFGDESKFLPFFGGGEADLPQQARSRDNHFQHVRSILTIR